MNGLKIFLAFLLVDFLALTGYALFVHGPVGFIEAVLANPATVLIAVDLLIALGLAVAWMVNDAKQRGVSSLPYLVLTALTGSAGVLLYLIRRDTSASLAVAN